MNLRQKAKYYKKLYKIKQIKEQPLNIQVHNFKTSYIQACKLIPYEMAFYLQDSEYRETIENDLARDLAKELKNIMDVEVQDYPAQCLYKVFGTVRVVTGVYY